MHTKFVLLFGFLLLLGACTEEQSETSVQQNAMTESQMEAYSIGVNVGRKAKQVTDTVSHSGLELDVDAFVQGIEDTLKDSIQYPEEDLRKIYLEFQKEIAEANQKRMEEIRNTNLAAANEFLEMNKNKAGVQITESGLQYKVLEPGEGASPGPKDTVLVHYTGRLADGTVFDTSTGSKEPRQFAVNRVVRGWTEGLQLMKEGGKFEMVLPPALGYGSQKRSKIPANSALVFDVELVKVVKQTEG